MIQEACKEPFLLWNHGSFLQGWDVQGKGVAGDQLLLTQAWVVFDSPEKEGARGRDPFLGPGSSNDWTPVMGKSPPKPILRVPMDMQASLLGLGVRCSGKGTWLLSPKQNSCSYVVGSLLSCVVTIRQGNE